MSAEDLQILAYNVGFGDGILVRVPDTKGRSGRTKNIMIDFGNVLAGAGANNAALADSLADVTERLEGDPVDLYVMTHEHLDHVKGIGLARSLEIELPLVKYAWLTASARPDYYRKYPDAKQRLTEYRTELDRMSAIADHRGLAKTGALGALFANNNYRSTSQNVAEIRKLPQSRRPTYVHRTFPLRAGRHHSFEHTDFEIWAPELRTEAYYGRRLRPVSGESNHKEEGNLRSNLALRAPVGVHPESFQNLLQQLDGGMVDNLLAIDRAANNTSIVFCIIWRGRRLLFAGDAEERSWYEMSKHHVLKPVDFLKIGHHGSHNGTPNGELLDRILPADNDVGQRSALLSTCLGSYHDVPNQPLMDLLKSRVGQWFDTRTAPPGSPIDIRVSPKQ